MRFFESLSAFLVLLPLITEVVAVPNEDVVARQNRNKFGGGRPKFGGGKNKFQGGFQGGNKGGTATIATAPNPAPAATSGAAAAPPPATGGNPNLGDDSDPQKSLRLDPSLVGTNIAQDGQAEFVEGQEASLTSTNNFINYCKTRLDLPNQDGQQLENGSCSGMSFGAIPSKDKMPSAKFVFPTNNARVRSNTAFTAQVAIRNLEVGHFTNPKTNYFGAPQQTNSNGIIKGHTHITAQRMDSLVDTKPLDTSVFAFFKGVNSKDTNGVVSVDLTNGLPAGAYRICTINTSANHAPVIVPVAQQGFVNDCVSFEVTDDAPAAGAPAAGNPTQVAPGAGTGNTGAVPAPGGNKGANGAAKGGFGKSKNKNKKSKKGRFVREI